jgi:hypothetical protein
MKIEIFPDAESVARGVGEAYRRRGKNSSRGSGQICHGRERRENPIDHALELPPITADLD